MLRKTTKGEKINLTFAFCNLHFEMLYSRRNATAPNKVFTLRFACPSGSRRRRFREYKTLCEIAMR